MVWSSLLLLLLLLSRFTSPAFATDSTDCVPIFSSVDPYSSIAFSTNSPNAGYAAASVTDDTAAAAKPPLTFTAAAKDAASCQAACGSDCHFWVFKNSQTDGSDGCWLKTTTATPVPNTYIAYKVASTTDYIVWPADTGELTCYGEW